MSAITVRSDHGGKNLHIFESLHSRISKSSQGRHTRDDTFSLEAALEKRPPRCHEERPRSYFATLGLKSANRATRARFPLCRRRRQSPHFTLSEMKICRWQSRPPQRRRTTFPSAEKSNVTSGGAEGRKAQRPEMLLTPHGFEFPAP